jgi:nitrile hydratase subunit beta
MNGIHDMGGMQDFGPVKPEGNEPVFHAPWEARAFALWMAVPGDWTINADRFQKELIPPAEYLKMSYYEKITVGIEELSVKTNLVTREELVSGKPRSPTPPSVQVLKASEVAATLSKGYQSRRDVLARPRFLIGQRVRARNLHPLGHTRLPRYARGKTGTIASDYGVFVFPDSDAQGLGEKPQHVYSVRFAARELWGATANPRDAVYINLWDDHLESL